MVTKFETMRKKLLLVNEVRRPFEKGAIDLIVVGALTFYPENFELC